MRIQFSLLGDAIVDHIEDMVELIAHCDKNEDQAPEVDESEPQPKPKKSPNLAYLRDDFVAALDSFYTTVTRIVADNSVDMAVFMPLATKAAQGTLNSVETQQFTLLKGQALQQGRAVGAVLGFFLKYKPYPMLAEIRAKGGIFQPVFGPVLVAEKQAVLETLTQHHDFTVDPYGVQMCKSMTPKYNDGFTTFILSTDDDAKYLADKKLLTSVVTCEDAATITDLIHDECQKRVESAVFQAEKAGNQYLDVVTTVARFVPVVMSDHYLGVPSADVCSTFELDDGMLADYGEKVTGPDGITPLPLLYTRADGTEVILPDSALKRDDGVIPDEQQVYDWIVATFRHFFNNVQNDIEVQAHGVRAYRELLVYILREIGIQKAALISGADVPDTMVTRLVKTQLGLPIAPNDKPIEVDANRVSDLRIAENVMGTIVGAVAGQEEATCRVIDSMMRLKEGDYQPIDGMTAPNGLFYGNFDQACELANNIKHGKEVAKSRKALLQYVDEALRLQPQGEVLLRMCVKDGAIIANSRPIKQGTLVFAAHGSAMQDIEQAKHFVLGRDSDCYLQFGHGRHKCLGQYVSPILMVEALVGILGLDNVHRPAPNAGETDFPLERRFGRFQLDDDNLYAKTFTLAFGSSPVS